MRSMRTAMARRLRAVAVGGGIGGLAAGLALHRAGLEVTIVEQAPSLGEVGAGLSLWPNAHRALAALGLAQEVARLGAAFDSGRVVRSDGAALNIGSIDMLQRFGAPAVCVRRQDLIEALATPLPRGALRLGTAVVSFDSGADQATAILDGGQRVAGDLLVGADGIHSVVRRQLGLSAPRATGALAWRGLAAGEFESGIALGPAAHAGWLPVGRQETYWFACVVAPPGTEPPGQGTLAELHQRFDGWAEPLPTLFDRTQPGAVLRHDLYDQQPSSRWGHGRVTLLGDAAHAMAPGLGQGACAALEDAVVLGACLRSASVDEVPAALRDYERKRQPRTARLQRLSARALRLLQPTGRVGTAVRELTMRLPQTWTVRSQGWIYRYDAGAEVPSWPSC
jgi:2-polyprenyl-6-methoxyphenol hydroxylase-like FAD-dependent oxidoreductase